MTNRDTYDGKIRISTTWLSVGKNLFDISTPEGRMAVRAFAWTLAALGEQTTKEKLLAVVGKDDG